MNYEQERNKIIKIIILVSLVVSVFLSGCVRKGTTKTNYLFLGSEAECYLQREESNKECDIDVILKEVFEHNKTHVLCVYECTYWQSIFCEEECND